VFSSRQEVEDRGVVIVMTDLRAIRRHEPADQRKECRRTFAPFRRR
jgi:hypothetical protein